MAIFLRVSDIQSVHQKLNGLKSVVGMPKAVDCLHAETVSMKQMISNIDTKLDNLHTAQTEQVKALPESFAENINIVIETLNQLHTTQTKQVKALPESFAENISNVIETLKNLHITQTEQVKALVIGSVTELIGNRNEKLDELAKEFDELVNDMDYNFDLGTKHINNFATHLNNFSKEVINRLGNASNKSNTSTKLIYDACSKMNGRFKKIRRSVA